MKIKTISRILLVLVVLGFSFMTYKSCMKKKPIFKQKYIPAVETEFKWAEEMSKIPDPE